MEKPYSGAGPVGPDEGRYDPRKGALGYSPIVASFGALAVAAIVVVFAAGKPSPNDAENLALATGLLAIGVFASFLGSFGLAAIAAEDDPTANLSAAIMFIAVPVVIAFIAILGAFDALSALYIKESTRLFVFITSMGGVGGVAFTAMAVGDSISMHPTNMDEDKFKRWLKSQWIQDQRTAYREAFRLILVGAIPVVVPAVFRQLGLSIEWGIVGTNWFAAAGIVLALAGTGMCLKRVVHPAHGNNQVGIRRWEAWGSVLVIAVYSGLLVLVLPL